MGDDFVTKLGLKNCNCLLVFWYWVPTINWIGQKGRLQFIESLDFTPYLETNLSQNYWLNALGNLPFKLSQLYKYIIKQPNPIINCQLNIIILIEYYRIRIFCPYIINHYVLWMSPIRLLKVKVLKLVLKKFFLVWKHWHFIWILRDEGRGLGWSQVCRDHNYVSKIVMLPP